MSIGGINAQQEQEKVILWIDSNVPKEVLAAIEAECPGLNRHQHLFASAHVLKKEKKVKRIFSWPSQTYHVQYKGKDYRKSVIYDKEGHLLFSKESIHNIAMPDAVYKYIGKEYNGWMIKKAAVVKTIETGASAPRPTVYYKVLLQNGKEKQRQLFSEHGEVYSRKGA